MTELPAIHSPMSEEHEKHLAGIINDLAGTCPISTAKAKRSTVVRFGAGPCGKIRGMRCLIFARTSTPCGCSSALLRI